MLTSSVARVYVRSTSVRWLGGHHHGDGDGDDDVLPSSTTAERINITFIQPDGSKRIVDAKIGESILRVAHRHEIDLEGACEGVCACSTCHLILPLNVFDALPEPSEEEEDMLDMAFGLTETSRLGCQITVTKELEGVEFEMPKATRNFYVDGHVPKPH